MDPDHDSKRLVARAALEQLPAAGIIGLGTGSTSRHFIEAIAELVRKGHAYVGVPTSQQSRELARQHGIPLLDDEGPWDVLLCVDGADEVSPELDLIKGAGGAHTREKIVNFAARRNVIVVGENKLSARLGERRLLPIEVLPFAHRQTAERISEHGEPLLREVEGAPFRTDSGNYIYDVKTGPIAAPRSLEALLKAIPGVVETGLFCARADLVLVARAGRVEALSRVQNRE
jgi:ribose 5-phosphate isomerase A